MTGRTKQQFSSVQFSCSVMSNSLRPHESQHARPPCPSPTPRVHPNSRPSSWWCHPAISSSVVPFSSCLQSLLVSESFPMSQLFAWRGQSTGVSALTSFLPKKSQGWSPSEWISWISTHTKISHSNTYLCSVSCPWFFFFFATLYLTFWMLLPLIDYGLNYTDLWLLFPKSPWSDHSTSLIPGV